MSIKYGIDDVKEIYVGSEPVSMVYAGRDLVWQLDSGNANGGAESSGELDIKGEALNYDNLILWYNDGTIEQHAGLTELKINQFGGLDLDTYEKKERLITHIHIPNTITKLEVYSLDSNLIEEIDIPGSVEEIQGHVLENNPIKKVTLNEGLKYLDASFLGVAPEHIGTVYVPDSVEMLDVPFNKYNVVFNVKEGIEIRKIGRPRVEIEYRP